MPSLLDQAIQVGKQLDESDQRLAAVKAQITQAEETLKSLQQETAKLERDSTQRVNREQTTWAQTGRDQEAVLTRIFRHGKHASVPPPIAPARSRQATFDWVAEAHAVARGLRSNVRPVEGCLTP